MFLFSYGRDIHGVYVVYSWSIHGIYVCIGYVSGMYRVCIGNVSKAMGRVGGGVPTTDEHGGAGNTIYISLVQCRSVQFSGQSITAERCLSVGDIPTTDEHGWARKHDIYILGSV